MVAMHNLGALLTVVLFIAAHCRLFDKPEFKVGGSFTVNCDVNRIGSVPPDVKTIQSLDINRITVSREIVQMVHYVMGFSEKPRQNNPSGRKWEVKASGNRGVGDDEVNRETIKITLRVSDAQCTDAGIYICKALDLKTRFFNRTEKLTSKDVPVLKFDYHKGHVSNKNATLTCYYEGIEGIALSWLTRPIGGAKLLPYPSKDDIKMFTPTFNNESTECGKYVSTLTFKPPDVDTFYVCMVKDGEKELSQNSYKFIVNPANKGTHVSAWASTLFLRNMFLVAVALFLWSRLS